MVLDRNTMGTSVTLGSSGTAGNTYYKSKE